jgi:hypothetical protein
MSTPEWQPIDTAPKDGTPIIGRIGMSAPFQSDVRYLLAVVRWQVFTFEPPKGYWSLDVCGAYAEDNEWKPAEWMPLTSAQVQGAGSTTVATPDGQTKIGERLGLSGNIAVVPNSPTVSCANDGFDGYYMLACGCSVRGRVLGRDASRDAIRCRTHPTERLQRVFGVVYDSRA